jgi:hypothetical protein
MSEVMSETLEVIPCGLDVPEFRKDFLLARINAIIADSWWTTKPHWSREESPFHADFGLVFAHRNGEIVAYSLYQRMSLDGMPVIFRAGAAVAAVHQGQGLYRSMTRAIFKTEWRAIPDHDEIYYAWRTRHPSVWTANAKLCRIVVPSIVDGRGDGALQEAGVRLGEKIYPGRPMETPSMVMRNAYDHMTYHEQPYHRSASAINHWFDRMLPDPLDAVFAVGIVEKAAIAGPS